MLAWVGRYGHQPVESLRTMPSRDLHMLAKRLRVLVEEENRYTDGLRRLDGD